jgi:hypothetical protein
MGISPIETKTMFTDFSSAQCRSKAEVNLALAERGGAARKQMLVNAEGWMLLADHLDFIETAAAAAWQRGLH